MTITDSDLDRPSVVGGGSVYPAVQNFLLACRNEGLGCVLTTLLCYEEAAVKDVLGMPEDWYPCAHIPVGYPVLGGHGSIRRRSIDQMVRYNQW
jgi:nitroreductase